ncbi:MAG: ATP-binding protein [Candidatus Bipolaricaulota bacterium]|nr:ATP-binding protein [Candidatus Bipolaricaulota bacterium]MCS7274513.1 ATP-binding protein [Candidatus Bipolaricaulota bacterium]MDW8111090.1 ATP-binding protein [Candidatus Bipolaricaulota bacterium]MDW8329080.1 ATP-binding protein [Candidatus Bipolaricaulota bacterium]
MTRRVSATESSVRGVLGRLLGVAIAYGGALLLLAGLNEYDVGEVVVLVGVPMLLSAWWFGVWGALVGALASVGMALPFVPPDGYSLLMGAGGGYLGVGLGVALWRRWKTPAPAKARMRAGEQLAFKRSLNFALVIDHEGQVLESNDRAGEVYGAPRRIWEFFHPDDQGRVREELERASLRGEAGPLKLRTVSQNKELIPVELKFVRLEPTRQSWLLLEMRDLSALAELENKVREAQARYRYLIEDAIDTLDTGILLLDKERKVIWANRTLEKFLGVDREELPGLEVRRALASAKPLFQEVSDFERVVACESTPFVFTLRNGDDERILEYRSLPVSTERYKGGRIDHFIDITEKQRLERILQEKTKRLEESNRKLEEFTHVVSHDLKEPLRTMAVFTQYLIEDYGSQLDQEAQDYLNRIHRASLRMRHMIDDLLRLSSIGTRQETLEKIFLGDVIEQLKEDLKARLENVTLIVPSSWPTVVANRTRMIELFGNLISNAIKYNDKPEKRVELSWTSQGGFYQFTVRDNGIGIEERYLNKVFELFERLNPRDDYESTGAGLAICKRIVEEYGGRIWVESKVGEGSAFHFTLPIHVPLPSRNGAAPLLVGQAR